MYIDGKGVPSRVEPRSCSELFRASAVEGAMKWRFYPLKGEDGKAVDNVCFDLTINFKNSK
jgi:hypothetical protein